jgi:hypothetical protein
MKLLPIVEIWWRDAECDTPGWQTDEDSIGRLPPIIRTVGMLLEKTDEVVMVCSTHTEAANNGRFRIPAPWIERFLILREGRDAGIDVYEASASG